MEGLTRALKDRRIGVACTPAARVGPDESIEALLLKTGNVRAFLALEHGLRGELQDGIRVDNYTDPVTQLPVFSFYGAEKRVPPAFFEDIDLAVFCVQDVSHRAYTFKQALASLLETAETCGKPVLIIDRPTPLAHLGARGPLNRQFFPLALPVVIPYTLGELGRLLVAETCRQVDLQVLPVPGWHRDQSWDLAAFPWIPPSPNIPSLNSAYAYLATGLFQSTNISEGRGTCTPFEYIGAPFIDPFRWRREMHSLNLPGLIWREVYFKPVMNKFAGQVCGGLHLMIQCHRTFRPLQTSLCLLQTLCRLYPDRIELADALADWLDGAPVSIRRFARMDIAETLSTWHHQCQYFDTRMQPLVIYNQ